MTTTAGFHPILGRVVSVSHGPCPRCGEVYLWGAGSAQPAACGSCLSKPEPRPAPPVPEHYRGRSRADLADELASRAALYRLAIVSARAALAVGQVAEARELLDAVPDMHLAV